MAQLFQPEDKVVPKNKFKMTALIVKTTDRITARISGELRNKKFASRNENQVVKVRKSRQLSEKLVTASQEVASGIVELLCEEQTQDTISIP